MDQQDDKRFYLSKLSDFATEIGREIKGMNNYKCFILNSSDAQNISVIEIRMYRMFVVTSSIKGFA